MTYSGDGRHLAVVGVDTNIYIVSYCLLNVRSICCFRRGVLYVKFFLLSHLFYVNFTFSLSQVGYGLTSLLFPSFFFLFLSLFLSALLCFSATPPLAKP